MPTCPRCVLLALVLAVLAFSGCDTNNPGSNLDEVAGTYAATTLLFTPLAPGIQNADILSDLSGRELRVEIFADGQATLRFTRLGQPGALLVNASARASSRTVSITANTDTDAERMATLLLPPSVDFARDAAAPAFLDASLLLAEADLEAYDPVTYPGLDGEEGRLEFELERVDD